MCTNNDAERQSAEDALHELMSTIRVDGIVTVLSGPQLGPFGLLDVQEAKADAGPRVDTQGSVVIWKTKAKELNQLVKGHSEAPAVLFLPLPRAPPLADAEQSKSYIDSLKVDWT